jgi:hypothetical protein
LGREGRQEAVRVRLTAAGWELPVRPHPSPTTVFPPPQSHTLQPPPPASYLPKSTLYFQTTARIIMGGHPQPLNRMHFPSNLPSTPGPTDRQPLNNTAIHLLPTFSHSKGKLLHPFFLQLCNTFQYGKTPPLQRFKLFRSGHRETLRQTCTCLCEGQILLGREMMDFRKGWRCLTRSQILNYSGGEDAGAVIARCCYLPHH